VAGRLVPAGEQEEVRRFSAHGGTTGWRLVLVRIEVHKERAAVRNHAWRSLKTGR
jgi:hypothetical protein